MLSEFENNLIAEMPVILDRKGRRWSLARSRQPTAPAAVDDVAVPPDVDAAAAAKGGSKWRPASTQQSRVITVIDEASV